MQGQHLCSSSFLIGCNLQLYIPLRFAGCALSFCVVIDMHGNPLLLFGSNKQVLYSSALRFGQGIHVGQKIKLSESSFCGVEHTKHGSSHKLLEELQG